MRLKANLLRVNGLVVTIVCMATLVACATQSVPTEPVSSSKAEAIDLAVENGMQTTDGELLENQTPEKVVVSEQRGDMELTLLEGAGYNQLLLKSEGQQVDCDVLELENPSRLVLDVPGLVVNESKAVQADESAIVSKVRLGGHGDVGRVVLDLREDVSYDIDKSFGSVVLTMRSNTAADMQMAQVQSEDTVVQQDMVAALPEVQEESLQEDSMVEQAQDSMVEEQLEVETVQVAAQMAPELRDLSLQRVGAGENALIADMESAGTYTFEQATMDEYVLSLEGASIAEGVEPTLVSPQGAGSIRSVRASQNGENIDLRIVTEPGNVLQVKPKGNKLVVAAHKESLIGADNVMAQADLEEEVADEEVVAAEGDVEEVALEEELPSEDDLASLFGAEPKYTGRLISLDLQDTEIDNALRIIAEVSNLNIIASDDVTGKVTLRLIDVPWDQALDVILKTNGLDKVQEGNVVRIAPVGKLRSEREALRQAQQAEDELEPLRVQYVRVSYAKAADLQPLVETVITERGTVTYDDRSNQLIVKDISKGLQNVARLVQKLDLRTPQVLIETQIIEAQRSFVRDLGAELGFTYIRSPETGNALGYNFPNSMAIGGSAVDASGDSPIDVSPAASFFPANNAASAVSALFGSADGSKSLDVRISAAEAEGRVRVVSRPSVAVTNNSPAVIKSVEKLRIKLPSGGVSVATGQGANAAGGGTVATETIEIGIVLNVTAQASPDYYVLLDINAKSSTLGPQSDSVDEIPPEIERSATSTVLVSSGQTFAMGGIYRITEDSDIQGVPFLKDIPVLGHFFRRTGVSDIDEELIFFITPRIIEGSFDDAAMKTVS